MYRLARKSTKIFNSYITSFEGFNIPGFGVVRFCNPISTASFTYNVVKILKNTYIGKVIASILENLNDIDYYHHVDTIVDGNLIDNTTTKFFFDVKMLKIKMLEQATIQFQHIVKIISRSQMTTIGLHSN